MVPNTETLDTVNAGASGVYRAMGDIVGTTTRPCRRPAVPPHNSRSRLWNHSRELNLMELTMKLSIRRAVLYRPFAATLLLFLTAYSNAFAAERIALVIGNATYSKAPSLNSPANDAQNMAETLSKLGFLLVNGKAHVNADKKEMANLISTFRQKLVRSANGTTALFYFSGHGLGYKGENWLIPVDDGDLNFVEDIKHNAIGSDSLRRFCPTERAAATTFSFSTLAETVTHFQVSTLQRVYAPRDSSAHVHTRTRW